MIADPVTFIFCTFGRYSRRRIRKACPDHKKARPNSATSQNVEEPGRRVRPRTVVERERHSHQSAFQIIIRGRE